MIEVDRLVHSLSLTLRSSSSSLSALAVKYLLFFMRMLRTKMRDPCLDAGVFFLKRGREAENARACP